jgi:hypothetical protein
MGGNPPIENGSVFRFPPTPIEIPREDAIYSRILIAEI